MTVLADTAARKQINEQLNRTLFVEAGAGSGKTRSLVERAIAIVLDPHDAVPLRHLAIVTFTEKAGAELRDRIRAELERRLAQSTADEDDRTHELATEALDDLDAAAIGTLHSFAQRILGEHPVEAGLPPLIEVMDEVGSGVAFDHRWEALRAELLDDEELAPALLIAMAAGMKPDDLRSMARAFTDNWDLLGDRVLAVPPPDLPSLDVTDFIAEARRLGGLHKLCTDESDKLIPRLEALDVWAERLEAAPDDPARLAVLREFGTRSWNVGRKDNWPADYPVSQIRQECAALGQAVNTARAGVLDAALRRLSRRVAQDTLAAAHARRDDGRLEFHDLLVLARELVSDPEHGATVRGVLHDRYRRILLDEFQDADPIQIELATRIAGGAAADAREWTQITVPDGRLFVVGDPKQSIYRFRRADIATYLSAQERIGDDVVLETNFRTTAPVLDWINHVFGTLIRPEPGSQPLYRPLHRDRAAAPSGPSVLVTGREMHHGKASADEIREHEANDVVASIRAALRERWQVDNGGGGWRDVRLDDIAILVPARTSLPQLEYALEGAGIPYRAEASSLVYRTQEVRDLLMTARAADDPSDQLALVSALRTPLFGCGDDDLWTWYQAGGRWNILAPIPDTVPEGHPVRDAVAWLKRLHNDRTWLAPSEVLGRIVADRRVLEAAVYGRRTRDVWRQLRFVVDQARAWSEVDPGGLRDYLAWAYRQGDEASRVAEAVLPETDTNTVRIMTIHAAKGLEFPVVIASGMSSVPSANRSGVEVLWPPDGGCEFKLRKDLQTSDFEHAKPIDEQMGYHERLRLLYVACTRARDHLVVSLHRRERKSPPRNPQTRTNAELLLEACDDAPSQSELPAEPGPRDTDRAAKQPLVQGDPPPPWQEWSSAAAKIRDRSDRPSSVGASYFEGLLDGTPPAGASTVAGHTGEPAAGTQLRAAAVDRLDQPADPGLAKQERDLELPPWNKGRYGNAVGRAVHGVLQAVELATGDGLDDAVTAQALAEGVAENADIVAALARSALDSETVRRAAQRRHWRETYVGTVIGDRVLEGFVDLVFEDDDGLVVVDFKTDTVPVQAIDHRVTFYRPQIAAYVAALRAATSRPVARGVLLFLSPTGAVERTVDDLDDAITALRAEITRS